MCFFFVVDGLVRCLQFVGESVFCGFFLCLFVYWFVFCGHSVGVIPGLVSIPVVKSFRVLFVYYGYSMGISFCCQSIYYYLFFIN